MKIFLTVIKYLSLGIITLIVALILLIVLYTNLHPTFGGLPSSDTQKRMNSLKNYDATTKRFKNLIATEAMTIAFDKPQKDKQRGKLLKNFLFPPKDKNPQQPLQTVPVDLKNLANDNFVWLGHSTILFKTDDTTIITDPVFHNASPVPFTVEPFAMTHTPQIDDLPYIDAVLISHDHYDHLDYKAIQKLKDKVGHFYVGLGVKAHLLKWGIPDSQVSEYSWYDEAKVKDVKLVFTPTRHFSGRGLNNRNSTLWGSWVVLAPQTKIYFSGDSGYSPEFAKIGKKFNGFDIAFIENGAYNVRWQQVHMLPEQSVQAGIDLQAKAVLPIHWGKFDLSTHRWNEPPQRFSKALQIYNANKEIDQQIKIATPRIGQTFSLNSLPNGKWWQD